MNDGSEYPPFLFAGCIFHSSLPVCSIDHLVLPWSDFTRGGWRYHLLHHTTIWKTHQC